MQPKFIGIHLLAEAFVVGCGTHGMDVALESVLGIDTILTSRGRGLDAAETQSTNPSGIAGTAGIME